jgi:L-alanine-DL-glutamate epimerase-like enolase superfamily enzyme
MVYRVCRPACPGAPHLIGEPVLDIAPDVRLRARRYTAPVRHGEMRVVGSDERVEGWLVEATDGHRSGWWGPVSAATAALACTLFDATGITGITSPARWAETAKRRNRHSHAGFGSVATGAAELALWDLAGQRAQLPVWALWGGQRPEPRPCYLTMFGVRPESPDAGHLFSVVRDHPTVIQKWDATDCAAAGSPVAMADRAGGPARLAIDFKGVAEPEAAEAACRALPAGLAWIEEPLAPWELHRAPELALTSRLAAGEHCYGVGEIAGLRSAGVTVFQPDGVFCGGLGELAAIVAAIAQPGEIVAPHGGGLLPALHLAAAGYAIDLLEWHVRLEPRRLAHLAHAAELGADLLLRATDRPGWAGDLSPEVILS